MSPLSSCPTLAMPSCWSFFLLREKWRKWRNKWRVFSSGTGWTNAANGNADLNESFQHIKLYLFVLLIFRLPCLSSFVFFRSADLYMPKFSISASASLGDILKEMGIVDAFSDKADFSGMSEDKELKVSNVWGEIYSSSLNPWSVSELFTNYQNTYWKDFSWNY